MKTNCEPMIPTLIFWFMRFSRSVGSLKSEIRRADDAGVVAEMCLHNFDIVLRDLCRARDLLTHGGGENIEVFLTNAAAENDALRQNCVKDCPSCRGRRIHRALHDGRGVCLGRRSGKYGAAVVEAKRLSGCGDGRAGRQRFPATVRAAITFRAVRLHGDMPEFRMLAVHSAINLAVHKYRTTDTGAERYHHERSCSASGAEPKLSQSGDVCIVLQARR